MFQSVNGIGGRLELASFLWGKRLWQRISPTCRARAHASRLFVAGVQRSGTNLLMEVLERSLDTDVYHETDPRAFVRYQLRDDAVLHQLIDRSPAPLVVIKCLMESQRLHLLLDNFAPARAIWVVRRYPDVVNSMIKSFPNQAAQVSRVAQGSDEWLAENMAPETLSLVRELTAQPLDDVSAAAIQWWFRNRIYLDQALDRDPRIMLLHYEDLVTAPATILPTIAAFAGIELGDRALRIITASSVGKRPSPPLRADVMHLCEALYSRLGQFPTGYTGVTADA